MAKQSILGVLFGRMVRPAKPDEPQETAQEMANRLNREFRERLEREDKMPALPDGTPNSIWYILEANRLRDLGRDDQADAILSEGYQLCARAGLDQAAAQLKKKIRGTQ